MITKVALITGITGQDGSYLAELLLEKGYEVHGLVRRVAVENLEARFSRIKNLIDGNRIRLHTGDVTNYTRMVQLAVKIVPTEIYHLAAQSFVQASFEDPFGTYNINLNGTLHILEVAVSLNPKPKFYFAATSEMFGKTKSPFQNEQTSFYPASHYGISKRNGFDLTRLYRDRYGLFACSGILFNHESPRRGFEFVTRKITHQVAKIKLGLAKELVLVNPHAMRDWGFAPEYVAAMWLILQHDKPDDYVIATGESHTIKEFVETAFKLVDLNPDDYVRYDNPSDMRPVEVDFLRGDSSKARRVLHWQPKTSFRELVVKMLDADLESLQKS